MGINLSRFITAQKGDYAKALEEIKSGRKRGHWMWYIFPQIKGLGYSFYSTYYAIKDIEEARAYIDDDLLGGRLREISRELLMLQESDAEKIFGTPDDLKLRSCMTLFSQVDNSDDNVFKKVIDKFFEGNLDELTIRNLLS